MATPTIAVEYFQSGGLGIFSADPTSNNGIKVVQTNANPIKGTYELVRSVGQSSGDSSQQVNYDFATGLTTLYTAIYYKQPTGFPNLYAPPNNFGTQKLIRYREAGYGLFVGTLVQQNGDLMALFDFDSSNNHYASGINTTTWPNDAGHTIEMLAVLNRGGPGSALTVWVDQVQVINFTSTVPAPASIGLVSLFGDVNGPHVATSDTISAVGFSATRITSFATNPMTAAVVTHRFSIDSKDEAFLLVGTGAPSGGLTAAPGVSGVFAATPGYGSLFAQQDAAAGAGLWQYSASGWTQFASSASGVSSFNTRTGAVTPTSGDYTVSQVTGAAPTASPTFTGSPTVPGYLTTASASSTYAPLASPTFTGSPMVPGYAPLASPTLTGTPLAPTPAVGLNTTQVNTTAGLNATLIATGVGEGAYGNLVTNLNPNTIQAMELWPAANRLQLYRVVVPATGTLSKLTIFCGVSSGNISVAIYDCGQTTTNTFTRLFTTGAIACPTAATWTTVDAGALALAVTAGQNLMFAMSCDNGTASFGGVTGSGTSQGKGQLPAGFLPGGGTVQGILNCWIATSHPAPTTVAVSGTGGTMCNYSSCIMAVIT